MSTVELWHTSGPTPTRIATVNTIGDLPPNTRGPVEVTMNVTPTPEGLDALQRAFAAGAPGTYEVRFAETPTSAARTWRLHGHLTLLHNDEDDTELVWKAHTAPTAQEDPTPHPPATTSPPGQEQCMGNAARLLQWAELETDLAKMNQYNELAQTWINLASLHQAEETL